MRFIKGISVKFCVLIAVAIKLVATTPQWHTASDGNNYLIESDLKYNWLQAFDECAKRDLQLIVIDSADKNSALVELLRSNYANTMWFWIGHHDEFNKDLDLKRPFYSASSGQKIPFSSWANGEPNNDNNWEHCAHLNKDMNFNWNDINCDHGLHGYICEKHRLTNAPNQIDLEEIRLAIYQKNTDLSSDFNDKSQQIKEISEKTRQNTNNVLDSGRKSVNEIIEELQDAINQKIAQKEQEIDKVTAETQQLIADILLKSENSINLITSDHLADLINNQNDIDKILQ